MCDIFKRAGRIPQRSKFWASGDEGVIVFSLYRVHLTVMFSVSHSMHLQSLANLYLKMVGRRAKRTEICGLGDASNTYKEYL